MPGRKGGAGGFTLLEVMIVLVIILAIAALVTVNLMSSRNRATENTVKIQLKSIKDGLRAFNLEFNRYPTDNEGLAVLWDKEALETDADAIKWRPFLEEDIEEDPWGSPWGYRAESEEGAAGTFDLWSNGPDKEEGTEDDLSANRRASGEDGGPGGDEPPPPR